MPVDVSPATALNYVARYYPETKSIIYDGGDMSAAAAVREVAQLAAMLRRLGVGEQDRVTYLGLNSPHLLLLHLACASIKAIFIPMNFRLAGSEMAYILNHSKTKVLIAEPSFIKPIDEIADQLSLDHQLVIDTDSLDPIRDTPGAPWRLLSDVIDDERVDPVPLGEDDIAALLYTSGTTGRPKAVISTHGNLFWNHVNVDSVVRTSRQDVTHAAAPLFHIGGLNAFVLRTLIRGGTVVVRRTFDPVEALSDLQLHKVTTLFGVPAMFDALTKAPGFEEADLSSLVSAIVAGAPVPPPLIRRYAKRGVMIQQAWGLTETSPFATYLPAEETVARAGSAGVPMPHTKLKLVDPATTDEVTKPGVRGELCVKGPNVTGGYWENPAANAAAFDDEGWFHTGDIGYLDHDGYVYVVDRIKDMIITGGENVYPAEVEHAIIGCPGVVEVAVVGAEDPKWGETVVAVVVPEPGREPTLESVREYAEKSIARYKLPRQLVVVQAMARNASGKLDKPAIRQMVGTTTDPKGNKA
ncbi:MAG: long-chain-fatty-acid--CoA ligase [Propionibacteriaceae bacterium]|nr:long-chain-fatty-acid--CoA ligase [Propionibacteriaceae bacterium]